MKNIRQKQADLTSLRLSPEEGFVLSRVDGMTSVKELVTLTGLDESRIVEIVGKLVHEGALDADVEPPPCVDATLQAFLDSAPIDPGLPDEPTEELIEVEAEADADAAQAEAEIIDDTPTEEEERNERNYRAIYAAKFKDLARDARVAAAAEATGADLLALCFDPEPQIVHAVVNNPKSTIDAARLVARHHRTQIGLESVARRTEYLKDGMVQRRLLRNPQLPVAVLHRLVNPKLLLEIYKLAIDREIPERTRVLTRDILRKKFMLSSSDEKVALLFKTEGRCLILLVACGLDAHATTIMCSKNTYTIMFIQNLARWNATPPALLAHLLKMQVVRRNVGLRKMVMRHPNLPAEAKKNFMP